MQFLGRNIAARWANWRAGRLQDPVERLKYLRRNAPTVEPAVAVTNRRTLWAGVGMLGVVAAVGARYTVAPPPIPQAASAPPISAPIGDVWKVETTGAFELYSNGLRIELGAAVGNGERHATVFDATDPTRQYPLTEPVGIIYHTTESDMAPFREENSGELKRLGESLLRYVARRKAYHYLIDRFGTVHRVVNESSPANHAGHSLWADKSRLYVNLNDTFIGVSFETQTARGDEISETINPAQIHAARILTDMLRARYHMAPENCVTHAQVSISPALKRIGNHTDWAANFPFGSMGLPDNYELAVPALDRFGFRYDNEFMRATGSRMWRGLALTEQRVAMEAQRAGKTPDQLSAEKYALYQRLAAIVRGEAKREDGITQFKESRDETGNSR